jgi:hypothetical protein
MELFWQKDLPDGREVTVIPLTFGRARIHIGVKASLAYDDGW